MADLSSWSQIASGNIDAPPDGAPEGMARKVLNDTLRENMAALRRAYEDPQWVNLLEEDDGFTVSFIDATHFNIVYDGTPARDASPKFPVGARVQLYNGSAFQYGFVVSTAYVPPNTSVLVTIDALDPLDAGTNRAETHVTKGTVGKVAFSPIGVTLAQDPPHIPSIDLLGDGVTKDEGAGNGKDADLLDGEHGQFYLSAAERDAHSLLINGDFSLFRRGTTIDSTNTFFPNDNAGYGPDQWALLMGSGATHPAPGSGVVDLKQNSVDIAPGVSPWSLHIEGNVSVGSPTAEKFAVIQMLARDRCQHLRSQRVSVSVWCKKGVGSVMDTLQIGIVEWIGAADVLSSIDPIADWGAVGASPSLLASYVMQDSISAGGLTTTTAWQLLTLENILVGSSMNNLGVMIWCDDQSWVSGDDLFLAGVNLTPGAVARQFVPRPRDQELLSAVRFLASTFPEATRPQQNIGSANNAASAVASNNGHGIIDWRFVEDMFKVPTVTAYNPEAANALVRNVTDSTNTAIGSTIIGAGQVLIETNGGGSDGNDYMAVHLTAEAVL